jgi:hypothetical protein
MKKQEELGVKGIRNKEGHNNGFFLFNFIFR